MANKLRFDRDAAIDTSVDHLWRWGVASASVKSLSEMLGITRSSFYNAFHSREAFIEEVLERYMEQSPDRNFRLSDGNVSVRKVTTQVLREVCRVRARDKDARGCLAANCLVESVGRDEVVGEYLEKKILGNIRALKSFLESGKRSGELSAEFDADTAALGIQSLLIGLSVTSRIVRSEKKLWKVAEATLGSFDLLDDGDGDQRRN